MAWGPAIRFDSGTTRKKPPPETADELQEDGLDLWGYLTLGGLRRLSGSTARWSDIQKLTKMRLKSRIFRKANGESPKTLRAKGGRKGETTYRENRIAQP